MKYKLDQRTYWDKVANSKTFSHEIDWVMFEKYVNKEAKILDYGCGYGRILNQLYQRDYSNIVGIDSSPKMIERAKTINPKIEYIVNENLAIPFEENTVDCVLLFAVLTCIPKDDDQINLIKSIKRILKPQGKLYISDLILNEDERNILRYQKYQEKYENYGVFELSEGAICRHHERSWFTELLTDFSISWEKKLMFTAMNGNKANGLQLLCTLK